MSHTPTISIIRETESPQTQSWRFEARVTTNTDYDFSISLSWMDYDRWCQGRIPPERVAKSILTYLLDQQPISEINPKFDCSSVRRHYPSFEEALPRYLGIQPKL